jgi:hypothetical protein
VVIPVHNRADLAAQCLAALARWTTPLEVIVIDDGSTDPGVELLRRVDLAHHAFHGFQTLHTFRWLSHPEPRGFSAAVNRGLACATGDPLLLLNSDAEVTEGGDHAIRAAFAAAEEARAGGTPAATGALGAVAARLLYPDGRPQWSGGAFPSLPWLFALASGLGRGARLRLPHRRGATPSGFAGGAVDWAPGAALAIARSAWETVGPFDESYRHYAQDLDYCQRLAAAGRSVRVLSDWVVVHHLGGSVGELAAPAGPQANAAAGSGYDGQRLDLLWLDLLHWARRHRGARWANRARRALLVGGRLRQLRLASRGDRRERRAVAEALAALAANAAGAASVESA